MKRISIGCMSCTTLDHYFQEIKSVTGTWYPDCWNLDIPVYFFTGEKIANNEKSLKTDHIIHLKDVDDSYNSASLKQWLGLKYLYDTHPSDFYMIVGTDNYVWGSHLLNILDKYNPDYPFLISGYGQVRMVGTKQQYFSFGGCGLILTRTAVKLLYDKLPLLYNDWITVIGTGDLRAACDLAMAYYAEQYSIVITRDYGLYSQNWLGDGKWGRINEGPINYETAAVFHYMNDFHIRAYHKYKEVVSYYIRLTNLCLLCPNAEAYNNGKQIKQIDFTNNNVYAIIINTIHGMVDSLSSNLKITGLSFIPKEVALIATKLGITVT